MADLYLFDGYNLLHAGPLADTRALVDLLASYVAVRGARGVVVFDGVGEDATRGSLEVRFAPHADTLLERLAARHRDTAHVLLVTSDATVAAAAGASVAKLSAQAFFRDLQAPEHLEDHPQERPQGLAGKLDPETNARLERLRRGE